MPKKPINHKLFLEVADEIQNKLKERPRLAGIILDQVEAKRIVRQAKWLREYLANKYKAGNAPRVNPGRPRKPESEISPAALRRRMYRERQKAEKLADSEDSGQGSVDRGQ